MGTESQQDQQKDLPEEHPLPASSLGSPSVVVLAQMNGNTVHSNGKAKNESTYMDGAGTQKQEKKGKEKKEDEGGAPASDAGSMVNKASYTASIGEDERTITLQAQVTVGPPKLLKERKKEGQPSSRPMTPRPLPTNTFLWGNDDFREVAKKNYIIVDKTRFIVEVLQSPASCISITRPSGFGKSFNLSMLSCFLDVHLKRTEVDQYFVEKEVFVKNNKLYEEHCGKYPVIYMTFKNITAGNFEEALQDFAVNLDQLYETLREKYDIPFEEGLSSYARGKPNEAVLKNFLAKLCRMVHKKCGKKPYLLIDAIDTPLYLAYKYSKNKKNLQDSYCDYARMDIFIKTLLSSAVKTNTDTRKAVFTGTMSLAPENLLNNMKVCGVVDADFGDCFGFTNEEVLESLKKNFRHTDVDKVLYELMWRYAGYRINLNNLAPPGIITKFIGESCSEKFEKTIPECKFFDQEITHDHEIEDFLTVFRGEIADDLAMLIANEPITKEIQPHVVFADIDVGPEILWTLLLNKGYLSIVDKPELRGLGHNVYSLRIPNQELLEFFDRIAKHLHIKPYSGHALSLQVSGVDTVEEGMPLLSDFRNKKDRGGSKRGIESVLINSKGETTIIANGLLSVDAGSQRLKGTKVEVLSGLAQAPKLIQPQDDKAQATFVSPVDSYSSTNTRHSVNPSLQSASSSAVSAGFFSPTLPQPEIDGSPKKIGKKENTKKDIEPVENTRLCSCVIF